MYANSPGSIQISNVVFSSNLVICGSQSQSASCASLISISNCVEEIIISDNIFELNYSRGSLIFLDFSNYTPNNDYISDGAFLSFSNVEITNNVFKDNGSDSSIIEISPGSDEYVINIDISYNSFYDNIAETDMIHIENNDFYPSNSANDGYRDVMIDNFMQTISYEKSYMNLYNLNFERCYSLRLLYIENFPNVNLNYPIFSNIWEQENTIDELIIQQFIDLHLLNRKFESFTPISLTSVLFLKSFASLNAVSITAENLLCDSNPCLANIEDLDFAIVIDGLYATNITTESYLSGLISVDGDSDKSDLLFVNVVIQNVTNQEGTGVFLFDSFKKIIMTNLNISDTYGSNSGCLQIKESEEIHIESAFLENIKSSQSNGGCFDISFGITNARLSISDSKLDGCSAAGYGAAIYLSGSVSAPVSFIVSNTKFINGLSESGGSSIYLTVGTTLDISSKIDSCTFYKNTAKKTGGVVLHHNGILTISDTIFKENAADSGPSGIYGSFQSEGELLNLVNVNFTNNDGESTIVLTSTISGTTINTRNCQIVKSSNQAMILTYIT